jgi:anthranilate synthase component 1
LATWATRPCKAFEDLSLNPAKVPAGDLPLIRYGVYRYVIAFNHFRQELHLFEHRLAGEDAQVAGGPRPLENLVRHPSVPAFGFATVGEEHSNQTDEEFLARLSAGRRPTAAGATCFRWCCRAGFSRLSAAMSSTCTARLRSINPSPYLFYFDYGDYKIFGSSPETQLLVQGREASLFPIAGTYRRSGDDAADAAAAQRLAADPKENAEHVMLVDLARNDLARHGTQVEVRTLREIQFYSTSFTS